MDLGIYGQRHFVSTKLAFLETIHPVKLVIGHLEFLDLTDFPARPHFRKPVSVCPYVETVQEITRTTPPETSIR